MTAPTPQQPSRRLWEAELNAASSHPQPLPRGLSADTQAPTSSPPVRRPQAGPAKRQENNAVSHFASVINPSHVAGSFNGSRHGNGKPVPAALGTKTKLRGGGGEGQGGEGLSEPGRSQQSRLDLTGGNHAEAILSPAVPGEGDN